MEESREGLVAFTDSEFVGYWEQYGLRMSSQGKVSCGNNNEQAKCKNGHGSNKSEGKNVPQ